MSSTTPNRVNQLNDGARRVFLNTFVFFSAIILRDVVDKLWQHLVFKTDIQFWRSIGLQFLLFFIIFSSTVIAGMYWTDYGTDIL